ncbi:MAG: cation:proton antiporter [Planctomycetes bacterium]|nr:cation:proton antiporter [Planctomycetota bacterium]
MSYQNLPYLLALIVVCIGLYAVVCKKNLIKIVVGIIILDYGANLFLLLTGYRIGEEGAPIAPILTPKNSGFFADRAVDPVPQALILTSIVIGLGLVALMTAMAIRIHEKYGTFDISEIKNLKG